MSKQFELATINWFPGHMTKALRMMEKELEAVDAILYVLDSRAPFSCLNPKLNIVAGNQPIIYILNKADMADENKVRDWENYFSQTNRTIVLDSSKSNSTKRIESIVREVLSAKIEKYAKKNINATIRLMVVGVPNCGKSTLINNLCGKARTQTGNIAGVTRGKQWVRLSSGIEVLDTPGTLWPAFDNNLVAHHLAYIGSIKEDVLDIPSLALDFICELILLDKTILEKRYKFEIDSDMQPLEILEKICKSRGFLVKGGEYDYDKGANALITDFKKGYLGNITLESVDDIRKLKKNDRKK